MKMYQWQSEFFRDVYQGCIVVLATDVESARAKAEDRFSLEYKGSMYEPEFYEDISKEPEEIDCIFIYG